MSRLTRFVLASLLTVGVIIGIYTSVHGASLGASSVTAGVHLVSGTLVNLDHYRATQSSGAQMQTLYQDTGQGCHSDANFANSDD